MSERRYDVIVVGGGVVGAATALALSRAGVSTALIERGEAPAAFDPAAYDRRVYALSPGSIRFLSALEVWPRIAAARVCGYQSMCVWEDSPGQALRFEAAEQRLPELGCIVENKLLLSVLWEQLREVAVYECAALEHWSADLGGVHVRMADGGELAARLLVAADGADSVLREQAGIDCVGWPYPQQAVVCHVESRLPHRHTAFQRFLPTGPLAFLPLADGRSSVIWSSSEAWMLQTLDDAAFLAALTSASQGVLGALTACSPRAAFPLKLLHAGEYVRARLALVGDAAHVIHPLAGQGINLGLADAEALTEILEQARQQGRDLGGLRVLKRYERERRADVLDMIAVTEGLFRLFDSDVAVTRTLRRTGMQAVQRLLPLKTFLGARAAQR
jgi:2-polyprenylphenol 6-hydroxylase